MTLREGVAVKPIKLEGSEVTGVQEVPSDTLDDRAPPPDDSRRELEEGEAIEEDPNPDQNASDENAPRTQSGVE